MDIRYLESLRERLPSIISQLWETRQEMVLDPSRQMVGYLLNVDGVQILAKPTHFPEEAQHAEFLNSIRGEFPIFAYYFGVFQNYILLEYIPGITLYDALREIPLADVWKYMMIVMKGIRLVLDKLKYVHADIHLQNIILRPLNEPSNVLGISTEYFPVLVDYSDAYLDATPTELAKEIRTFLEITMDVLNEEEHIPEGIHTVDEFVSHMSSLGPLPSDDLPVYP